MKKNISINIGGIIFHIEEDGFDRLKNYLDSINAYFSTFEDSKEIIDDIENRIAEIFLSKLGEGNQVITSLEIDEVIAVMGTVADFEASIDSEETKTESGSQETASEDQTSHQTTGSSEKQSDTSRNPKRLFRDEKRRVLGGVAAGVAHYFRIDAIWVRLIFLLMFFNVLFWGLSGLTFLAYIILWIVLPANDKLEDDTSTKKLFRNSEERVLGGISSGIAAYFGTDSTVVRLLFVLSIFLGGAGIILYIILWIITPQANSITEKMQMQGEPVTLSNIETNVKKSLKVEEGEENVFAKILLFPFRLIAMIFGALERVLGPLLKFMVEAFRVVFGAVVTIAGFSMMLGFLLTFLVMLGISGAWSEYMFIDDLPIDLFTNSLTWLTASSIFLVLIIPALSISLLGMTIILKRRVGNAYMGWSLFGLWIFGLIGTSLTIPALIGDFRTNGDHREEIVFEKKEGTPLLKLEEDFRRNSYEGVDLRLRGHADSTFKLVVRTEARGGSRAEAEDNAQSIEYKVIQQGSDFIFDAGIDFKGSPFRLQEVDAIFYIPFGQTFRIGGELDRILTNSYYNDGYRSHQLEGNDWMIDRSGLNCLTCESYRNNRSNKPRSRSNSQSRSYGGSTIPYDFENFNSVKIASAFTVEIVQDKEYKVELRGRDADEVNLVQYGDELEIKYRDSWNWWDEYKEDADLYLFISAPDLESIELIGGCDGEISGIDSRQLTIKLTGATDVDVDVSPTFLVLQLVGASKMDLAGRVDKLDANVIGASQMNAFDMIVNEADINAVGASKVEIHATEQLDIDAAGVSTVRYRGTQNVNVDSDGLSKVRRD